MSEISMIRPDPHDFLDVDSFLTDEEVLLRNTVRQFVADRILPEVGDWWDLGVSSPGGRQGDGVARPVRDASGRLRMCRARRTWRTAWHAPARVRRFGRAVVHVGAGFAVDVPDLEVRISEEQKETWLPRWRPGDVIGCFG
jgi:glutaryl-CoA dehydrogenase